MVRTVLFTGTLVALLASAGHAQLCAGLPSLRERPLIATLDVAGSKDAASADLGLTAGRTLFAAVSAGTIAYQNVMFAAQTGDASSSLADVGIGYQLTLAADAGTDVARVALCPVLTAEWESGPDGDFGSTRLDSDGWTLGAGLLVGGLLFRSPPWRLMPLAGASFVRTATTVHDFPFAGTDSEARDDGWLFSLGLGLGIGSRVTVSPAVAFPVSIAGGESTYSLGVSVGFGPGAR